MEYKTQMAFRYGFAFLLVSAGILLNYFQIGGEYFGFSSIGNWLIFIGFVMFIVITLNFRKGKRMVDERMQLIALKASKIAFVFLIFGAFIIMVIDGIKPIAIPYSIFMSNLIAWIVLVYFVAYKILERRM